LPFRGHPGQLHQVVMNLVQNAIDATAHEPEARITVRGGVAGATVWLTVRDNGPGIAEADLVRVFDPFFTTKPVGQGTGLGLSISYGIVADHGGTLTVRNHPDGGAEFRIEFPAQGRA
jgi:two-component system sensor histidine kinase HupT/HoxJ